MFPPAADQVLVVFVTLVLVHNSQGLSFSWALLLPFGRLSFLPPRRRRHRHDCSMGCGVSTAKVLPVDEPKAEVAVEANAPPVPTGGEPPKQEVAVAAGDEATASEAALAAPKAEEETPWPPASVTIEGKEYTVGKNDKGEYLMLGKGVWADVFKGTGPDGQVVALKMLRGLKDRQTTGKMPPRNAAEQQAENVIECKIHKYMHSLAAGAGADCAKVPTMLGSDATSAAIEFVEAISLEDYLRKTDRSKIEDADAAAAEARKVQRVLAIVLKKVLTLYGLAEAAQFLHRDLNDGNIMLRVNSDDVSGVDDVDVWLFDFGKSMAMVDGGMVSGGMWDPSKIPIPAHDDPAYDACRISAYNATTDTVRLLCCINQSLIRSYETTVDDKGKKVSKKSPTGATRAFLEEHMPFRVQMATWLAHTKAKLGDDEFDKLWTETIAESKRGPTTELSGKQDYLDFAAQPSFDILRKYYVYPQEDWCECMLPAKLGEFCDEVLAS